MRFALDRGWHLVSEGIMHAARYCDMLDGLRRDHVGRTTFYYFDVSWREALRRHRTRPQANEFSHDEMQEGYRAADQLGFDEEHIIPGEYSLDGTVRRILGGALSESVDSSAP